jgi:selenocysteine-specific elongation factor
VSTALGPGAAHASAPPLTLGTAGHVDHGKTELVRALTGRDTDRLPEEHERGISIELGYAQLELPGGRRMSVVDVPGHERFVRTMVAGATGIDLFLLCVAADDGVMPQTREHAAVLRQLGVARGVVAVTKADVADPAPAAAEAPQLVPGAPAVAVSALTGEGLGALVEAIAQEAAGVESRAARASAADAPAAEAARLHVDRSFSLRGIGTVVTGTLWSGAVAAGDYVRVLPAGLRARVRSVQVHDRPVARADAGQRVALALAGVGRREVARGDVVCGPGAELEPAYLIDALVSLEAGARPLRDGERLQVHHGTREVPARVALLQGEAIEPGGAALAQLRLEGPLMPARDDRFVLRRVAPPDTIGGGRVLDPRPRKHRGSPDLIARLRALARGEEPPGEPGAPSAPPPSPQPALDAAALRMAELLRADGHTPRADGELAAAAGLEPAHAARALRALVSERRVVRVARNLHFDPQALEELKAQVVAICERDGQATIAGVRDELGTSRRYAQALLEHLDAERITRRSGDAHVLRRERGSGIPSDARA